MSFFQKIFLLFLPFPAYAENPYLTGALSIVFSIVTAIFFVCYYKVGPYLLRKIFPDSPVWVQKVSGIILFIAFLAIWVIVTEGR